MANEGVMSTNDDASSCKRYATSKGYWKDDYIQHFVRSTPLRKAPEINRGYYLRHVSMKSVIDTFLTKTGCNCQIISLGAGFDTTFRKWKEQNRVPNYGYFEVDMKPVVQKKIRCIQTREPLNRCLDDVRIDNSHTLKSKEYCLVPIDITEIADVERSFESCRIKYNVPTLFIVECVFVYIKHENVDNLLNYISQNFSTCMIVDYDPVNLGDRFGDIMKQNLRGRDCHLFGAHATLESKIKSYKQFRKVDVKLLLDIYNDLPKQEKSRIEKIEFLDEVHLLYDLLGHYCISIAVNDNENIDLESLSI